MKGRNSTVISVRLPDRIVATLAERANRKDMSIGEYLRQQILKSCSVNTTDSVNTTEPIRVYHKGTKYEPGEQVIYKGKIVTAPEVDAEGYTIYNE